MEDHPQRDLQVLEQRRARRALTDLKHGGHLIPEGVERSAALAASQENILLVRQDVTEDATPFDYLFPGLPTQPDKLLPADIRPRPCAL